MEYKYLKLETNEEVTTLWLNRPEVHNAFHNGMIDELLVAFDEVAQDEQSRILLLRGLGKSFCAGADLNWMKKVVNFSFEENHEESLNLSECLNRLYNLPKPTIAYVHGAVYGGGNGLMSACDFVFANEETRFSLSEVNLGLIPACISPYIIKKTGEKNAKSMMLRGHQFGSKEAKNSDLIDEYGRDVMEDQAAQHLIQDLITSGPKAIMKTKSLIHSVVNTWSLEEAKERTAQWITETRMSDEGQEGMTAFFEKRKPNWIKK